MYTQISQIVEIVQKKRKQGVEIIGFVNGCFDILHVGHLALLEYAKEFCEYLIVAIDDDENVRRLKGPSRPINSSNARARLVGALKPVDIVTVFSKGDLEPLLAAIRPNVVVKGEEYRGRVTAASEHAGILLFMPMFPGFSTTETINKNVYIIPKVWGYEEIIVSNDKYCGKYLHFNKGAKASLHYHNHKDETFKVLSGTFRLEIDNRSCFLGVSDSIRIFSGEQHRLKCLEAGVILEISTADDPLDCVRLEPSKAAPDIQQSLDL